MAADGRGRGHGHRRRRRLRHPRPRGLPPGRLLQQAGVASELRCRQENRDARGAGPSGGPGSALERLWLRMAERDGWVFDAAAFAAAVTRVRAELADGLLVTPFDGSMAAERAVAEFSASLIDAQAGALLDVLTGRAARLWTDAMAL